MTYPADSKGGSPGLTARSRELEALREVRQVILEIGRPTLRVHDLRFMPPSRDGRAPICGSSRKTMGHASITVTAHIYADLYDDELDDVASALDALNDRNVGHV